MGIRRRNLDEQDIVLNSSGGNLAVANGVEQDFAAFAGFISNLFAVKDAADAGAATQADIRQNGVTIFSGATKIQFADGATVATYGPLTSQNVAKGDRFSLDIKSVAGAPGKGLVVHLRLTKRGRQAMANLAPSALL